LFVIQLALVPRQPFWQRARIAFNDIACHVSVIARYAAN